MAPAITNPFSRHPVTSAAAVATLAELAPGPGVARPRRRREPGARPARPGAGRARSRAARVGRRCPGSSWPVAATVTRQLPWIEGEAAMPAGHRRARAAGAGAGRRPGGLGDPVRRAGGATARGGGAASRRWARTWRGRPTWPTTTSSAGRSSATSPTWPWMLPPEIRAAAGLDADRVEQVRAAMLAGRLDEAAALLPETLVDHYARRREPRDLRRARIADLAGSLRPVLLPMNDVAGAERTSGTSAAILRDAAERVSSSRPSCPAGCPGWRRRRGSRDRRWCGCRARWPPG